MNLGKDPNFITYQNLVNSNDLFALYKDKYVAIVDGTFVDLDINRDTLLQRIRVKYADQPRFVSKVTRCVEVTYLPSPLEIISSK
jgi:hypothetical protein